MAVAGRGGFATDWNPRRLGLCPRAKRAGRGIAAIIFVFDLDDTLYPERSYAHSALAAAGSLLAHRFAIAAAEKELIASFENGERDPIGALLIRHRLPGQIKRSLIEHMGSHLPKIALRPDARTLLGALRSLERPFAILSDGRSITQRRKIEALGCGDAAAISISEECGQSKFEERRWKDLEAALGSDEFCYVGDNPAKDFLVPNRLGWKTVMLRSNGGNIHSQDLLAGREFHPQLVIDTLESLLPGG